MKTTVRLAVVVFLVAASSAARAHATCTAATCCAPLGGTSDTGGVCLFSNCAYADGVWNRESTCTIGIGPFTAPGTCVISHGHVSVTHSADGTTHLRTYTDWVSDPLVAPSLDTVWPPRHDYVPVDLVIAAYPPLATTIDILSVRQDEPVEGHGDGHFAPDAIVEDSDTVWLRAERSGKGDGRVYHIAYRAVDAIGTTCAAEVTVCVPHHWGAECGDGGALYDSLGE